MNNSFLLDVAVPKLGVFGWLGIAIGAIVLIALLCVNKINKLICLLYSIAASVLLSYFAVNGDKLSELVESFGILEGSLPVSLEYIVVLAAALSGVWAFLFSLPIIMKVNSSLSLIGNILVSIIVSVIAVAVFGAIGGGLAYVALRFELAFILHLIGPLLCFISFGGLLAK